MRIQTLLRAFSLAMLLSGAPLLAAEDPTRWTYEGAQGPAHWGELDPRFAACAGGRAQSPVNLDLREPLPGALPPLTVHYRPAPLDLANDGHTLRVNAPPGSTVLAGDQEYPLLEIRFHAPGEHAINDKLSDMEVQFVHTTADGHYAIVALMLEKGAPNAGLKSIWAHLPKEAGDQLQRPTELFDPAALLPDDLSYVGYTGSLTTPPCTEGVTWIVMTHRGSVSENQLAKFTAIFPPNNRPLQPLNDRPVQLSR